MKIARYLDAAIPKPDMTPEQAEAAIKECIAYEAYTVCVRGCDIALAKKLCEGTQTKVSCVLDFPYGYGGAAAKRETARLYSEMGVFEIDMVMNYGAARGGNWDVVEEEVRGVVEEAHRKGVGVKVIFETSQLTDFNGGGATVEAVKAMLETANGRIKVKPSGGIRNYETAKMYIDMGASRLGCGYTSCKPICEGEGESKDAY